MILRGLVALALALVPTTAAACAVCLDSAFGDRGFNVAFVAFMLTPFAVAASVGAIVVWLAGSPARRGPDALSEEGDRC